MFKKHMMQQVAGAICVLCLGVSYALAQETGSKIEVVTTLFPTYDFCRQVGKDKVNVTLLLPPGVEAHAFEPKPHDIARINKADVFIYTGAAMEPWVEDILKGVSNKDLIVVDASMGIALMGGDDHTEEGEHHEEEQGMHHHGGKDPHIWLDLGNAQMMVSTIASALAAKDPANRDFYAANAGEYNAQLNDLDNRFKQTLSTAQHKTIIYAGHFAFGYFTKRYGLTHVSPYQGFSPDAQPRPRAIVELIKTMRVSGQKYVYFEELLDPKVARVIASETGASLELLSGAHNVSKDDLAKGVTFVQIMEKNLEKLKVGLVCQPR
jgi:zinc transport system substrate-binding protein